MIANDDLAAIIRTALPDADVEAFDYSGTMDHFNVTVRSRSFAGKSLLEQHRMVYGALDTALKDGRVHAVQIRTLIPEN